MLQMLAVEQLPGRMSVAGWSALPPGRRVRKGLKALAAQAPRPLMACGSSSSQQAMKACRSTLLASWSSFWADAAVAALAVATAEAQNKAMSELPLPSQTLM